MAIKCKCGFRWVIVVLLFFATFTSYMCRVNMSVSIITMVKKIPPKAGKAPLEPQCQTLEKGKKGDEEGPYEWDEAAQSYILGAYFYGYIFTCLPAGLIAEYFGPFHVVFWTNNIIMGFNALTPLSSSVHWGMCFACRFIIGMMAGLTFPALNVIIARWAPPAEKGKFLSAMLGNTIGSVVTWVIIPPIKNAWNWEGVFYSLSAILAVFQVAWWFLVTDRPEDNRFVSDEEKEYIHNALAGNVSKKKGMPPFKKIFMSLKVWALIIAQFGNLWVLYLILSLLPKYMKQVLGFDLKAAVVVAAAPYLGRFISGFVFGSIGDYLKKNEIISTTKIRKFFTIFSHILPGIFCIGIVFAECNLYLAVALFVLNQSFNGACVIGHLVNNQDLSPNFAGTIYGIHSFIGGTTGFIVPALNAVFIKDAPNEVKSWSPTFYIAGSIVILCGIFFMIFCSGEVQPWNEPDKKDDEEEEEE